VNKKGIELSMNIIIIAVLGLIILAVLLFFVYQTMTGTKEGTECAQKRGICMNASACTGIGSSAGDSGCTNNNICCVIGAT
jgi:hypothetical protein